MIIIVGIMNLTFSKKSNPHHVTKNLQCSELIYYEEFRDKSLEKNINFCNFGSRIHRTAQLVSKESYLSVDFNERSVACLRACPGAQLHGEPMIMK